jgi:hypothetical protein
MFAETIGGSIFLPVKVCLLSTLLLERHLLLKIHCPFRRRWSYLLGSERNCIEHEERSMGIIPAGPSSKKHNFPRSIRDYEYAFQFDVTITAMTSIVIFASETSQSHRDSNTFYTA